MSASLFPRPRSPSDVNRSEALLSTLSLHKQSLKRLELPLHKCIKIAVPLHLEILSKHRSNIEKFYKTEAWDRIHKEQINAQRTVQQLKSCIQEIDVVRSQVQDEDLPQFDKLVKPVKDESLQVIQQFLNEWEESGFSTNSPLPLTTSSAQQRSNSDSSYQDSADTSDNSLIPGVAPLLIRAGQSAHEAPIEVDASWGKLKEDLVELNELIHGFSELVTEQQASVDQIEENVDASRSNVIEGVKNIAVSAKLKPVLLPIAGALIGTCVAGPVGLLAGLRLGSVAAAFGGGLIGFQSARMIKKQFQKKIDLDIEDITKLEQLEPKQEFHSLPDLRDIHES